MRDILSSVVARYKAKKRLDSGNTVYMYSDKQVAERNRRKAQRLEKLRKNIKHLRSQVKRDLTSDDPEKSLTALAVGLMDATAERVGSNASASGDLNEDGEPHYGVTTWTKKHISFGKGGATIKYVGKSGVKHVKKVSDAGLVKALRKAYSCVEGDDCIFNLEKGSVSGKHVNAYLKTFGVTAKDLRGFHANSFMKQHLKAIRAKGGKLPEDKKEREKKLKDEFKAALEKAAEDVGHEPSTLRSQYLIPGLEERFLKDGTVSEKMTKEAAVFVKREPYEEFYPATDCFPPPEDRPVAYPTTPWNIDRNWDGSPIASDEGSADESVPFAADFFRRHPHLRKYADLKVVDKSSGGGGSHGEARQHGNEVWLFPKFWKLDPKTRDFVFAHEIGHYALSEFGLSKFIDLASSLGVDLWDTSSLPFGQHNMDEAFADSFASFHLEPGELRRRYIQWEPLVSAVMGRSVMAGTITKRDVEKYRSDLRRMTKIYKSVPAAPEDKQLELFEEAKKLFIQFRENWDDWVYRYLLPTIKKESQKWIEEEIRKKAWDASISLSSTDLFPSTFDYTTNTNTPSPWKVREVIERNTRKYQREFNEVFALIDEYLDSSPEQQIARPNVMQKEQVAGMHVVIWGFGRDDNDYEDEVESFIRQLNSFAKRIERAGFGSALKGLTINVRFADPKTLRRPTDLTAGQYNSSTDSLDVFPLGFIMSDGGTFTHEVGHRYWYRNLSPNARAHWEETISSRMVEITREEVVAFLDEFLPKHTDVWTSRELQAIIDREVDSPERAAIWKELADYSRPLDWDKPTFDMRAWLLHNVGEKVQLEYISDYARTNPTEAFAEAFRFYIIKGPGALKPWTLWFFKEVVKSGGAKFAMLSEPSETYCRS